MSESPPRIAAYVRVSTEEQKEEGSHENQRERIQTWADRHDYPDVEYYEDIAISGQSENRDGYHDLMESFDAYDAVVVRELSRFGRDPLTVLQDVEEIIDSDTDFVSITEDFDTTTAMGKAFVRMVAVINGMYADLRREQAVAAAERRKEQGLHVGRPRKLDDAQLREVYDLRKKGVSYSAIASVMAGKPDGPEELSRETVRRYCDEADVEPVDE
jgi:site-specific DNA recombinase